MLDEVSVSGCTTPVAHVGFLIRLSRLGQARQGLRFRGSGITQPDRLAPKLLTLRLIWPRAKAGYYGGLKNQNRILGSIVENYDKEQDSCDWTR